MSISIDHASGVSWGAVFAGAACAAALSFILLILGFGLGLSAISPWSNTGATLAGIGISSIIWVAFTQIVASGMGGYLAGRLRVRWASIHNDEVYFRDTAHGLITWSVSTLAAAVLLSSALTTVLGGGLKAGADINAGAGVSEASLDMSTPGSSYFADSLLRTSANTEDQAEQAVRNEVSAILLHSMMQGEVSADDRQYLTSVIVRYTGINQSEATARVNRVMEAAQQQQSDARELADQARRAAAYSALWMFIALLCGAFFASLMATFGGRQRDQL